MGAGASKPGNLKESLYELLGVSYDADTAALKKAYRQKALELHPDRNFNNVEKATAMFARVQAAYDLLNDPQERQWYDQHRKSSSYKEYDGELTSAADVRAAAAEVLAKPSMDFAVVAGYFEKLKHEEQEASFEQGTVQSASIAWAPTFGTAHDSWAKVKPFYDAWAAFSTIKNYEWEDIYPMHAAQDRRTRRKFEQANKKVRDASKREFNAAVRQAVHMLRQKDPRRPSEPTSTNRAKQDELIAQQQSMRAKEMKQLRDVYSEQEWQKPEMEDTIKGRDAPELLDELVCIVCDVNFETEFDKNDHLRTNKHKRAAAMLKQQLMAEDELLNGLTLENEEKSQDISSNSGKPAKLGKAKAKARKKQQAQHILTCGTCGIELPGGELIAHKQETRHP